MRNILNEIDDLYIEFPYDATFYVDFQYSKIYINTEKHRFFFCSFASLTLSEARDLLREQKESTK